MEYQTYLLYLMDVMFCEIKKPKGVLSELQRYRLKELEKHGFKTEVYKG